MLRFHKRGILCIAAAAACGAGNVHVRQKLYIQADDACAVAHRAAQPAGVVGKISRLKAKAFGVRRFGIELAQFVVHIGVCGHGRAHVDADGCGVNELCPRNAGRLDGKDVGRQLCPGSRGLKGGHKAFQHKCCFPAARDACHHGEPAVGDIDAERLKDAAARPGTDFLHWRAAAL